MLETITMTTFNEGNIFKLYYGDHKEDQFVQLTLTKISESKYIIPNAKRKGFSLLFTSSKDFLIEPGIHQFSHEKVGNFEMSICPVVAPYGETELYFYEAVFN